MMYGIRSRLRARSGVVKHCRPVRIPMIKKPSHTRGMTRPLWRRERDSNPCEIALKRFSRPPRYDHFDIPPYKRNYKIVLEKTLEEKTLLSEKCACFPQIRGFFAGCFRCGKEVSRPPRYDRFDIPPYLTLILYHKLFFLSTPFCYFPLLPFSFRFPFFSVYKGFTRAKPRCGSWDCENLL